MRQITIFIAFLACFSLFYSCQKGEEDSSKYDTIATQRIFQHEEDEGDHNPKVKDYDILVNTLGPIFSDYNATALYKEILSSLVIVTASETGTYYCFPIQEFKNVTYKVLTKFNASNEMVELGIIRIGYNGRYLEEYYNGRAGLEEFKGEISSFAFDDFMSNRRSQLEDCIRIVFCDDNNSGGGTGINQDPGNDNGTIVKTGGVIFINDDSTSGGITYVAQTRCGCKPSHIGGRSNSSCSCRKPNIVIFVPVIETFKETTEIQTRNDYWECLDILLGIGLISDEEILAKRLKDCDLVTEPYDNVGGHGHCDSNGTPTDSGNDDDIYPDSEFCGGWLAYRDACLTNNTETNDAWGHFMLHHNALFNAVISDPSDCVSTEEMEEKICVKNAIMDFQEDYGLDLNKTEIKAIEAGASCGNEFVGDAKGVLIDLLNLKITDTEKDFLKDNFSIYKDIKQVLEENNHDDYGVSSAELYTKLASVNMLNLSHEDLAASESTLDDIITNILLWNGLNDRLVISPSTWYMIFKKEASTNGGSTLDWLRAEVKALKDGFIKVFKPLVDTHVATLQAAVGELGIPASGEEWRALMAVFGPMLLELGVDIGTDFIPIVGEIKAFTKSALAMNEGNYSEALFEFIGGVAGILPIGDLVKGAGKVIIAGGAIFTAFKVVKALAKVSSNIYSKLIKYAKQGWKMAWDDGVKKLIFKNGDEVVGAISKKTENITDPLDSSYPDGNFDVPTTTITKADGWALKQGDDIAESVGTVPTGQNQAFIGKKNIANHGQRIKADHPAAIKNQVDEIVANGDNGPQPLAGVKTEALSNDVLEKIYPEGTVHSNVHYSGNKGFDNIVVMPDGTVIINEAKQMNNGGGVALGITQNGSQMSSGWIDGAIEAMKNSPNPQASGLYNTLKNAPNITRVVTAVDKTTGEIVITKLNPF